jgi:putative transposase
LFGAAAVKHDAARSQLTPYAGRDGPEKAKAPASMRAGPGAFPNRMAGPPPRRPYPWNDNPFSESHFKTLKYQPQFPKWFGCIEDAKTFRRSLSAERMHQDGPKKDFR